MRVEPSVHKYLRLAYLLAGTNRVTEAERILNEGRELFGLREEFNPKRFAKLLSYLVTE